MCACMCVEGGHQIESSAVLICLCMLCSFSIFSCVDMFVHLSMGANTWVFECRKDVDV